MTADLNTGGSPGVETQGGSVPMTDQSLPGVDQGGSCSSSGEGVSGHSPSPTGGVSEMVERAARAICTANGEDPDSEVEIACSHGQQSITLAWAENVANARAAIAALREPTQRMLMASGFGKTQKAKFQAMIDEALR